MLPVPASARTLRARWRQLNGEHGSPDLLAFMAFAIIVIAFGITILMPAGFGIFIESMVRQDPRLQAEITSFMRDGTDTPKTLPVKPCANPSDLDCLPSHSERIKAILEQHPFVSAVDAVDCGALERVSAANEALRRNRDDYVIRREGNPQGFTIVQDDQVACRIEFTPISAPGEEGFALIDTVLGDKLTILERGVADSAINTRIH